MLNPTNYTHQHTQQYFEPDPRFYTSNVKNQLNEIIKYLRAHADRVHESRPQVLFEMTAEVLNGIMKAYDHYERDSTYSPYKQNPIKQEIRGNQ